MSHEVQIKNTEPRNNAVKIFLEITIDGEKCGYPKLDGEKHEFNFDIDYDRYQDNEKVKKDAAAWAEKVVKKRVEEFDPSEDPTGTTLQI